MVCIQRDKERESKKKGDPKPRSDTKIDATLKGVRRVEKVSANGPQPYTQCSFMKGFPN